ncbi:hypothetical protein AAFF_G00102030 [Aldrovandia affinis]|uniref:Uncharacterized protein n=1 Tax=Aldrovandia affinis TaxID=143900 RepID=A0AAD7WB45_9TELE|nr:hypothetical protein AAFF_G00102030 [Aldrovandia affinis]
MTSIKRSSPGAIPEPRTPTSSLLSRQIATLVSGSGIELREVEEAIRELEERLGVLRWRKTGATEMAALIPERLRQHTTLATPRSLEEALKEAERAEDVLCPVQARQPAPASAKLTTTRRRRKSPGHALPRSSDDNAHRRYDVAAVTAVTSQDT